MSGLNTEAHFHLDPNPDALRVPATALMFGEKGVQIATVDAKEAVLLKTVQVGQDIGTDVEVVGGLSSGDRLIDSPLETLNTGDKVRMVKDAPPDTARTAQADQPRPTN